MEYIKKEVKKFADERGWTDQSPSDIAKSVVIEAAELLEKFQWKNHNIQDINKDQDLKQEIISELADVFIYSAQMANLLDCNIENIVDQKLSKQKIKYPVDVVKGDVDGKKYLEIKKKHRTL